jgi:hypothetical protein
MADVDSTQAEADSLIAMEKHRVDDRQWFFSGPGERISIPLISLDKREQFTLDVTRGQIKIGKVTYQNRARQAIVLMRLDIDGPPHRYPDGEQIPCPHLHTYREGYGDKWAAAAPLELYPNTSDLISALDAFMVHCNITNPPDIQKGLF